MESSLLQQPVNRYRIDVRNTLIRRLIMANKVPFCTCNSHDCPHNPCNHDEGCTPCVLSNLESGEIPACFFNIVDPERKEDRGDYLRKDFARIVQKLEG
jgi:hypothetical protein